MEILEKILKDNQHRKELIVKFQSLIWDSENVNEILSQLAYDLDFYESNPEIRKEDPSYYGDEKLEEIIKSALQNLSTEK